MCSIGTSRSRCCAAAPPDSPERESGEIAEALGDLPLALAQAAAYLTDTATDVKDYLALLAERTTELLAQDAPATYPVPLAASAQVALERLMTQSPAALQLLTLTAYLAPEPIPLTLFTSNPSYLPAQLATVAGDPLAFAELTRLLRQHGLARVEPPQPRYGHGGRCLAPRARRQVFAHPGRTCPRFGRCENAP